MNDINDLFEQFKGDAEKLEYFERQQQVITNLLKKNKVLTDEIEHLKQLLTSMSTLLPATQDQKVERVIITPEEHLIDRQITLIQERGLDRELTLEDTKKLDLLLKNKTLIKSEAKDLSASSKPKVDKKNLSNAQLIQIAASQKKPDGIQ